MALSAWKPTWDILYAPNSTASLSLQPRALWYYRVSIVLELCVGTPHLTSSSSTLTSCSSDPHTFRCNPPDRYATTCASHGTILPPTITTTIRYILPISLATHNSDGGPGTGAHLLAYAVQQPHSYEPDRRPFQHDEPCFWPTLLDTRERTRQWSVLAST